MGKNRINKIYCGAIGFEGIALFGMILPAAHGFAGLMDIEILQGKAFHEIPTTILFIYRFANYIVEPGLIISLILGAVGFASLGKIMNEVKNITVPSVKAVVWSLGSFAVVRNFMILSGINYENALNEFIMNKNLQLIQFASMWKGLSALTEGIWGIMSTVFILRFFNHKIVQINQKNPGKTGAKLILISVILGIITKSFSMYYYPQVFSALFIVSQIIKSMGLTFISFHLLWFAYNQPFIIDSENLVVSGK